MGGIDGDGRTTVFRIFNPTLQAIRHDPDGAYVRRWVPELAGLSCEVIHAPPPGAYVAPIVDPRGARARAITAYRDASALANHDRARRGSRVEGL